MRTIHKHRCRWLYRPERKPSRGAYSDTKGWPKAMLFCWQTGKNIRAKECVPCLLALGITSITNHSGRQHKQPMSSAQWQKRHPRKAG